MTEIVKKSAPLILAEILKSKNILLHCHPSPDPDSVGSALAMKLALESLNKKVTLIQGDSEIPKAFQFPGVETITKKSYGEIDINEFDLFIILDSAAKDRVSSKCEVIFPSGMMTIDIDHHASNPSYGIINCVDSTYPATAQIIFDLLKEMNIVLTHDIALNLIMGIYADTGGFQYGNLDSNTFKVTSELVEFAPDFSKVIFIMNNSNRKEKLVFEGLALSSIKEFFDGKFAVTSVSYEQLKENKIGVEDYSASFIANTVKSVVGLDIAVSMIEEKPGLIKISMRTRDSQKYDVSKLSLALGGGGHKAAAGASLNMTIPEAINKVVETAKIIYNL